MSILKEIAPRDCQDPKCQRINWNFDYLATAVGDLQTAVATLSSSGGTTSIAGINITDTAISSSSPSISAPSSGILWFVILRPTGSAPATLWGSGISADNSFDSTNGSFTVFILVLSPATGRWIQAAPAKTGLAP